MSQTCMPHPVGSVPAATCPSCGACSTYTEPERPSMAPAVNPIGPDGCGCRCHDAWRFINHRPLAS